MKTSWFAYFNNMRGFNSKSHDACCETINEIIRITAIICKNAYKFSKF